MLSGMSFRSDPPIANRLLHLKAKAAKAVPWTAQDRATVRSCFEKDDDIGVLAGCCVLVSGRTGEFPSAIEVVRRALQNKHPPPYVELSIYEALLYVEAEQLKSFVDGLLSFIGQSLSRRAINLDNTTFLLGRMARCGEARALAVLRALAQDTDTEVRESASRLLNTGIA